MFKNESFVTPVLSHTPSSQNECYFLSPALQQNSLLFVVDVAFCILNSIFAVIAITGNSVVIITIWRTPALRSPSMTLLRYLAFSDLVVGIVVQPCSVVYRAAKLAGHLDIYCTFGIITELVGWTSSGVSFLTLTAIGFERYLALHLHLRHEAVVTNTRIFTLIICLWLFYGGFSVTRFWISRLTFAIIVLAIFVLCVTLTSWGYIKIFKLVKRHHRQILDEARISSHIHGQNRPNIDLKRYKRSVVTSGLVVAVYIFCYLPLLGVLSAYIRTGYTSTIESAYMASAALVFMNSTFNSIIYGWRMKEIREAVLQTFKFRQGLQP